MRTRVAVLIAAMLVGGWAISPSPVRAARPAPASAHRNPNPSSTRNELTGVSAMSAKDVWAVGSFVADRTHTTETLILHWDGTRWSKVTSPNPSSLENRLTGVSAVSATDAWAVGWRDDSTDLFDEQISDLIFHWDGTSWTQVASPNPSSTDNELWAASAVTATDAWAVGSYLDDSSGGYEALVVHWDGTSWSRVTTPNPGSTLDFLSGVSAVSTSDASTVGSYRTLTNARDKTLAMHWDGTTWSRVRSPSPNSRSHSGDLFGVDAVSAGDAWAVGYYGTDTMFVDHTLIINWDGASWSRVKSPNPSEHLNHLFGVGGVGPRNMWAVGAYGHKGAIDALILHWDGRIWSKA